MLLEEQSKKGHETSVTKCVTDTDFLAVIERNSTFNQFFQLKMDFLPKKRCCELLGPKNIVYTRGPPSSADLKICEQRRPPEQTMP